MNNEKNFYDIVRSKFSEVPPPENEHPVDEQNWKAMRTMIDKSRAGKKRILWLVASLAVLLCAGGAYWTANSYQPSAISTTKPQASAINTPSGANSTASVATTSSKVTGNNSPSNPVNSQPINQNQSLINTANAVVPAKNSIHPKSVKNSRHSANSISQNIATTNEVATINKELASVESNKPENIISGADEPVSTPASSKIPPAASNTAATQAPAAVAKTATHKADSAATANALPPRFSNEPRIFRGKTDIFSLDLGLEYSFGWAYGNIVQGKGINPPTVGVGYAHYLGKKWFVKTGLQFSFFGNMNTFPYDYQHIVTQSGNYVTHDSVITTNWLYFLRLPVHIEKFVTDKVSLGGGIYLSYLLGNSGFATTYQEYDYGTPVNIVKYSQNASLSEYTKVNTSAYVFSRYVFSHKFSMNGGIYYGGLAPLKNNAFFGENSVERTVVFQVMASYSFN